MMMQMVNSSQDQQRKAFQLPHLLFDTDQDQEESLIDYQEI